MELLDDNLYEILVQANAKTFLKMKCVSKRFLDISNKINLFGDLTNPLFILKYALDEDDKTLIIQAIKYYIKHADPMLSRNPIQILSYLEILGLFRSKLNYDILYYLQTAKTITSDFKPDSLRDRYLFYYISVIYSKYFYKKLNDTELTKDYRDFIESKFVEYNPELFSNLKLESSIPPGISHLSFGLNWLRLSYPNIDVIDLYLCKNIPTGYCKIKIKPVYRVGDVCFCKTKKGSKKCSRHTKAF